MTNSYYQLGIAEGLAVGLSYSYISVYSYVLIVTDKKNDSRIKNNLFFSHEKVWIKTIECCSKKF